ncbi:hypothetical protein HGRIS_000757 [Hohenbuehelia grisea]|uniref:MYND-type domain-containing protein n=1 Tax=Hohenbuehelia grisea TaxID=104357 RepID=A0ABR3IPM0_9AGAR
MSPVASDGIKATAHALLMRWFLEIGDETRPRYFFSAVHHANAAARLGRGISARGFAAPDILSSGNYVIKKFADRDIPEVNLFYKDLWEVLDEATARFEKDKQKATVKRLKHPNKYRCANPGCGIQGDTGKMLRQCSGKCDRDKKPSYCTPECQRADWKNHKPFCAPGQPCSVIDDGSALEALASGAGAPTADGAIQIPVPGPDGRMTMLSSSTMDPEMLREIRDLAQAHAQANPSGQGGGNNGPRSLHHFSFGV